MFKLLRPAFVLLVSLTVITGLVYPLAMTGLAGLLFPKQAQGSLIVRDGKVIGSELIGQFFTSDRYFHGRQSATTGADPSDPSKTVPQPYNAANSMGSNLGPTNRAENPSAPVPLDLVTTTASGLDPDISPAAAYFQVPRVAKARSLPEADVKQLVDRHIESRLFGLIGEPHINVLALNLDLDRVAAR